MLNVDPSMDSLDMPASAFGHAGGASASPAAKKRPQSPKSAPDDLRHFMLAAPVVDVARELGLTRGTVYRLRDGYWPADPSRILQAWSRFKADRGVVQSWFLRRVRGGGLVRHAGQQYSTPGLAVRVGQMLALARAADGSLLAQTLELPAERFVLAQLNTGF